MKKETIKKASLEILSIVFAVLLALGLTHWREEVNMQKKSDRALSNILIEIHMNTLELTEEFNELQSKLESMLQLQNEIETDQEQTGSLGFTMPVLSNSAWSAANATGAIENFDLELLMDLSSLYRTQEVYQDHGLDYFKNYSSLEFNKEENFLAVVKSNVMQATTTLSLGEQLSQAYTNFYKDHNSKILIYLPDSLKTRYAIESN